MFISASDGSISPTEEEREGEEGSGEDRLKGTERREAGSSKGAGGGAGEGEGDLGKWEWMKGSQYW